MKKIKILFFSTVVFCIAFCFVSCAIFEDQSHDCTYGDTWCSDDTYHWHVCIDENCTNVSDKSEHIRNEEEVLNICSICRRLLVTESGSKNDFEEPIVGNEVTEEEFYAMLSFDGVKSITVKATESVSSFMETSSCSYIDNNKIKFVPMVKDETSYYEETESAIYEYSKGDSGTWIRKAVFGFVDKAFSLEKIKAVFSGMDYSSFSYVDGNYILLQSGYDEVFDYNYTASYTLVFHKDHLASITIEAQSSDGKKHFERLVFKDYNSTTVTLPSNYEEAPIEPEHICAFTLEIEDECLLAAAPICGQPNVYFKSCECGATGTETFISDIVLPHNFVEYVCTICGEFYAEQFNFTLLPNDTYEVNFNRSYKPPETLMVPATYLGKPITVLSSKMLYNILEITTIKLPSTLLKIGEGAFEGCSNLKSIEFYNASVSNSKNMLDEIGERAFAGSGIVTLDISNSYLSTIGVGAFSECDDLISVTLPLGLWCIQECKSLSYEEISDSSLIANYLAGREDERYAQYGWLIDSYCHHINTMPEEWELYNLAEHCDEDSEFRRYCSACGSYLRAMAWVCDYKLQQWGWQEAYNSYGYGSVSATFQCNRKSSGEPHYYTVQANLSVTTIEEATCLIQGTLMYVASVDFDGKKYEDTRLANYYADCDYQNGYCTNCGQKKPSAGLNYSLSDDSTHYILENIGNCTDEHIVIANFYRGLPVKAIRTAFITGAVLSTDSIVRDVEIPNNVEVIQDSAFANCLKLENVIFQDDSNLKYIGSNAFYNCESLSSIEIPEKVETIRYDAFRNCYKMEQIILKASALNVSNTPTYYGIFENCGIQGEGIGVVIKNNVTLIPDGMFCTDDRWLKTGSANITSVNFEEGSVCTYIGRRAFAGLPRLKDFEIPSNVITVGDEFLYRSGIDTLYYNALDLSSYNENGILNAYDDDVQKNITLVIGKSVKAIPSYIFSNSKITQVIFEDNSICSKIEHGAFQECYDLIRITIPDSIKYIENAFSNCEKLNEVYISDLSAWCQIEFLYFSSTPLGNSGDLYLNGNLVTNVVIPSDVTKIHNYAFLGCTSLTSIELSNSVTDIGDWAFYNCINLKTINIPDSVTSIGEYAFCRCLSLNNVGIPDGVTAIETGTFEYCSSLTNVNIGYNVTSIGSYVFAGCSKLACVVIPDNVTTIGERAFGSALRSITVGESVTYIGEANFDNGNLVEIINHSMLDISDLVSDDVLVIHQGESRVVNVDDYLFITYDNINYLLGYIGSETDLILPESYNGESYEIYREAFYASDDITSVTIPDAVTVIGSFAFYGCRNLLSVSLGKGVIDIEYWAFADCVMLIEVINRSNLDITKSTDGSYGYIGYYALYIDDESGRIVNVNDYLFITYDNVNYLLGYIGDERSITLPESYNGECYTFYTGFSTSGDVRFFSTSKPKSITLPMSLDCIEAGTFLGWSSLMSITIPDSITNVGESAFGNCNNIKQVYYCGSAGDWAEIIIETGNEVLNYATVYFYSLNEPVDNGSYWHYDSDGNPIIWV